MKGLAILLACAAAAQTLDTFGGTIVLGRPTDRSVTVNALFPQDQEAVWVEYGDKSGTLDRQTTPRAVRTGTPYQDVLAGLSANQRYYYRIRFRKTAQDQPGASAEHTFMTQRAKGASFTFTLIADSHLFTVRHCLPARYAQALANARADNPDFHIDLGDTFRSDTIVRNQDDLTYKAVVDREASHRPFFHIVTADAPLYLVNGNHDSEYLYYTLRASGQNANLPLWATNARVSLFPNPVPDSFYSGDRTIFPDVANGGQRQSYYAWEWGDALFVALDPYWLMPAQNAANWVPVHGDVQYAWLRDTLRRSTARYKFVFAHHLLGQGRGGVEVASQYEWGGQDPRRTQTFEQARPGWESPIHKLMVETGVTAFFQGHDHLFAAAVLDGIQYISVPMPGAGPPGSADYFPGNEEAGNFDAYPASLTLPSSGHLRVNVSASGVRIEYLASRLTGDPGANRTVLWSKTVGGPAPELAVVSTASYMSVALAPGSIATAFGARIAPTTSRIDIVDSTGRTYPAQVLSSTTGQANFVIPASVAVGLATVSVPGAGSTRVTLETPAPSLFSANATGFGAAAATAVRIAADGTRTDVPVFSCGGRAGGCTTVPMSVGAATDQLIVSLYGTGFGGLGPSDVVVHLGNYTPEVLYVGPQGAFAGLDQINLRIPRQAASSGELGLVISAAGKPANVVLVNIQ